MERIRVQIAADGSAAEAIVATGAAATADDVHRALERAGVRFGIDDAAVAALAQRLADAGFAGTATIARGEAPEPGTDGRIECPIDTRLLPGRVCADGHIDWRERELLHPIADAEPLGRIIAPTPGRLGHDVRGRPLAPRAGQPSTVRIGDGVRRDGDDLFAARAGVLLHDARQFDVVPLYTHATDVDLRSGNLHTEGSLEVRGDVREGATATAVGDVVIRGAVQSAKVTSGGSVAVAQGVLGRDSLIEAGAGISCRHATSARFTAGGTVEFGDHAALCSVSAEHVVALHGRGAIVGGELRARASIRLIGAGAGAEGAPTLLAVADLSQEQAELVRRGNVGQKIERQAVRTRRDPARHDGKLHRAAVRSGDEAQQARLRLLQRQRELLRSACIEIHGTAHPGVRLRFGAFTRQLDEARSRTRFVWDPHRDDIHEEPLT